MRLIFLVLVLHGCSVADDLLEDGEVFEVSLAARGGDARCGLGPPGIGFLRKTDHAVFFEYLEMASEVAVSQIAELFQLNKTETAGVSDKRG